MIGTLSSPSLEPGESISPPAGFDPSVVASGALPTPPSSPPLLPLPTFRTAGGDAAASEAGSSGTGGGGGDSAGLSTLNRLPGLEVLDPPPLAAAGEGGAGLPPLPPSMAVNTKSRAEAAKEVESLLRGAPSERKTIVSHCVALSTCQQ